MRYLGVFLAALMITIPAFAEETDFMGSIARSAFTTQVVDREPMDEIVSATNDVHTIYYFSEVQGMSGQQVRHRWLYEGEVKAEVSFDVGGPRWRVWSSKSMLAGWTGEWTVQVIDENGQVLAEDNMSYEPVAEQMTEQQ